MINKLYFILSKYISDIFSPESDSKKNSRVIVDSGPKSPKGL